MKMKILEINTFNRDEAKEKALEQGLTVVKDVTRRFIANNCPEDIEAFAKEQFEKDKLTDTTGTAYIITKVKGSADMKNRPYTFNNVPVKGSAVKSRVFEIRTVSGVLVDTAKSKGEASRKAKAAMKEVKENMVCEIVYRVDDEHKTAFTLDYTPSKNTTLGTYIVFGN